MVMRKLSLFLLLTFLFLVSVKAGSPSYTLSKTGTETLTAGDTAIVTLSNQSLTGDSLSFMISYSADSITTGITYLYTTPDGNYNTAFADADSLGTYVNLTGTAVFADAVPRLASTATASFFFTIINNNTTTQVVTYKIYTVIWR